MANSPPEDPKVDDTWINDVSLNDTGELRYWDGKNGWVLYEDPPESPGGDPVPNWLHRKFK
jgi:hypothetical protein